MFGLMDLPIFQSHSTSEQEQEGFNHELLDALSDNTIFTPEFGRRDANFHPIDRLSKRERASTAPLSAQSAPPERITPTAPPHERDASKPRTRRPPSSPTVISQGAPHDKSTAAPLSATASSAAFLATATGAPLIVRPKEPPDGRATSAPCNAMPAPTPRFVNHPGAWRDSTEAPSALFVSNDVPSSLEVNMEADVPGFEREGNATPYTEQPSAKTSALLAHPLPSMVSWDDQSLPHFAVPPPPVSNLGYYPQQPTSPSTLPIYRGSSMAASPPARLSVPLIHHGVVNQQDPEIPRGTVMPHDAIILGGTMVLRGIVTGLSSPAPKSIFASEDSVMPQGTAALKSISQSHVNATSPGAFTLQEPLISYPGQHGCMARDITLGPRPMSERIYPPAPRIPPPIVPRFSQYMGVRYNVPVLPRPSVVCPPRPEHVHVNPHTCMARDPDLAPRNLPSDREQGLDPLLMSLLASARYKTNVSHTREELDKATRWFARGVLPRWMDPYDAVLLSITYCGDLPATMSVPRARKIISAGPLDSDIRSLVSESQRCKDDEDVRLPYHPLYNLRHGYSTKYIYIDPNKQKSNMRANFARYPFRIHDLDFQGEAGRSMWRIMSRQDKGVARRVGH
eukprot:GEMP01006751.1.p1 GENE.GEMP01006751.1~~GEMP01006751.1.p1  ORF type:complete len:624 (+),score=115.74 GEMP01006751.1:256-2127(+)